MNRGVFKHSLQWKGLVPFNRYAAVWQIDNNINNCHGFRVLTIYDLRFSQIIHREIWQLHFVICFLLLLLLKTHTYTRQQLICSNSQNKWLIVSKIALLARWHHRWLYLSNGYTNRNSLFIIFSSIFHLSTNVPSQQGKASRRVPVAFVHRPTLQWVPQVKKFASQTAAELQRH